MLIPHIKVIKPTPLMALIPPPAIATMTKGNRILNKPSWIIMVLLNTNTSRPVFCAKIDTGIPTAPNAVGTVFATSEATAALKGSKPSAIKIPIGIATAVP